MVIDFVTYKTTSLRRDSESKTNKHFLFNFQILGKLSFYKAKTFTNSASSKTTIANGMLLLICHVLNYSRVV